MQRELFSQNAILTQPLAATVKSLGTLRKNMLTVQWVTSGTAHLPGGVNATQLLKNAFPHVSWVFCFVCLLMFLCFVLSKFSLCSFCCPETQTSACLCLAGAEIHGMCQHAQLPHAILNPHLNLPSQKTEAIYGYCMSQGCHSGIFWNLYAQKWMELALLPATLAITINPFWYRPSIN